MNQSQANKALILKKRMNNNEDKENYEDGFCNYMQKAENENIHHRKINNYNHQVFGNLLSKNDDNISITEINKKLTARNPLMVYNGNKENCPNNCSNFDNNFYTKQNQFNPTNNENITHGEADYNKSGLNVHSYWLNPFVCYSNNKDIEKKNFILKNANLQNIQAFSQEPNFSINDNNNNNYDHINVNADNITTSQNSTYCNQAEMLIKKNKSKNNDCNLECSNKNQNTILSNDTQQNCFINNNNNNNSNVFLNLNHKNNSNVNNLNINQQHSHINDQMNNNNNIKINPLCTKYNIDKRQRILVKPTSIIENYRYQTPIEYIAEIWNDLRICERKEACWPKYEKIKLQKDMNWNIRAILIDWLIDVHLHFRLSQETLYLCIFLIDSYLAIKNISRPIVQLLGITSLFIAAKYEEIYPPLLKDLANMTENAYSENDILKMEGEILETLDFDICYPSVGRFTEIISINFNFIQKDFHQASYLTECFMLDSAFNKYFPCLISFAVTYIIMQFKQYENYQEIFNLVSDKYMDKDIQECAIEILKCLRKYSHSKLKAVQNKYSSENFHKVALLNYDGI